MYSSARSKENQPYLMQHQNTTIPTGSASGGKAATGLQAGMLMSPPPEETLRHAHLGTAKRASREDISATAAESRPLGTSPASNRSTVQANRKRARPPPEALSQTLTSGEMATEGQSQGVQYTPNPRVRKQKKRDADNITSSPSRKPTKPSSYSKNALADYLTPIASSSRGSGRRSTTPIPPYDPPTERFTPPREIILSPAHTTRSPSERSQSQIKPNSNSSAQGKSKAKPKRAVEKPPQVVAKITRIKTEPPEVDLSAPPPPASPSDDPILLVGQPVDWSPAKKAGLGRERQDESMLVDFVMETEIVGAERERRKEDEKEGQSARGVFDFDADTGGGNDDFFTFDAPMEPLNDTGFNSDSDGDDANVAQTPNTNTVPLPHTPLPKETTSVANLNDGDDGGFSDDDDDDDGVVESEGEGDYTGKFRTILVPTKVDPPSSAPRERSDRNGDWVEGRERRKGRKKYSHSSPHPRRFSGEGWRNVVLSDDEDEESEKEEQAPNETHEIEGEQSGSGRDVGKIQRSKKGRRLTLSDIEAKKFGDRSGDREGLVTELEAESAAPADVHEDVEVDVHEDRPAQEDDLEAEGDDLYAEENPSVQGEGELSLQIEEVADSEEEDDHSDLHEHNVSNEVEGGDEESFSQEDEARNDAAQPEVEDNRDHDHPPFDNEYSEPLIYETRDVEVEHEEAVVDFGCVDDEQAQTRLEASSQNVLRRHQDQLEGTEDYGQVGSSLADHSRTSTSETAETQVFTFTRARRRSPPVREEARQDVDIDADANAGAEADADADDDSDPLEEVLPDVVKIVSSDAKAAARAAAILKLHDYDMVARRTRQGRPRTLEERLNRMRRRTVVQEGVAKAYSPSVAFRRKTFAGSERPEVDDNVQEHALPDLLREAERELIREGTPLRTPQSARTRPAAAPLYSTPSKSTGTPISEFKVPQLPPGPRTWVKADWKWLDSCFTDVRYELAELRGKDALSDVDEVSFEVVMERFIELMGGWELVQTFGVDWTRDKILQRIRALCKKQRSGRGAPLTPQAVARLRYGSVTASPASTTSGSMIVPDFTPTPAERLWKYGVGRSGSASTSGLQQPKIPAIILAPRYAHLQEEMPLRQAETGVSDKGKGKARDVFADDDAQEESELEGDEEGVQEIEDGEEFDGQDEYNYEGQEGMEPPSPAQSTTSAVGRSIGYISSWFKPTSSRATTPQPAKRQKPRGPQCPALPVPPASVLSKRRPPVNTPAKKAVPRSKHPKELVSLNPAPKRDLASRFLSRIARPKRLVELQHLPTPAGKDKEKKVELPEPLMAVRRRSSATSVRDMVKGFEELDKRNAEDARRRSAGDLKRVRSLEGMKAGSGAQTVKPAWRP